MDSTEVSTVTKKHPGRVAQGHKLTALMKQRKEELLKKSEQNTNLSTDPSTALSSDLSTILSSDPSTVLSTDQTGNNNIFYGLILIICGGGMVYFLSGKHTAYFSKKTAPMEPVKKNQLNTWNWYIIKQWQNTIIKRS